MEISNNSIIVGDLNEDQLDPRNHYLKDVMTLNNLLNVIVVPTRKTAQSETLLDPIVVHDSMKVFAFGSIDVDDWVSDHTATYVYVSFTYDYDNSYKRMVWFYNRGDFEKLTTLILNYNWEFFNNNDIDTACQNFTTRLNV